MTPEEVRFIIQRSHDQGAAVVSAAVVDNHPMWRLFFQEGWVSAISSRTGEKRDFLERLYRATHPEVAAEVLTAFFQGKRLSAISATFVNLRQERTLLNDWAEYATVAQYRPTAEALLAAAKALKVNFDGVFSQPMRRGPNRPSTPLSSIVDQSAWDCLGNRLEQAGALTRYGARFTPLVCQSLLEIEDLDLVRRWMDWAEEQKLASASDVLSLRDHPKAIERTVAFLQAMAAHQVISGVAFSKDGRPPLSRAL